MYITITIAIEIYVYTYLSTNLNPIYLHIGACVVALGEQYSALYTNHDQLTESLTLASKQSQDLVWSMPLATEYIPMIKGTNSISDVKNLGTGADGAGSITAALFLQEFVGAENCENSEGNVTMSTATGTATGTNPNPISDPISKNIQWAHIDMAGPVWNSETNHGTGWGVKLLTQYVMNENDHFSTR